jgi:hypothetical protein
MILILLLVLSFITNLLLVFLVLHAVSANRIIINNVQDVLNIVTYAVTIKKE